MDLDDTNAKKTGEDVLEISSNSFFNLKDFKIESSRNYNAASERSLVLSKGELQEEKKVLSRENQT